VSLTVAAGVTPGISPFSTDSLLEKIHYIQKSVDPQFRMILNRDWCSENPNHRHQIRKAIESHFTASFSREQLALLSDLNWRPQAQGGYFSISHCKVIGGFTFSQYKHGFDVEQLKRVSVDILKRTCSEKELQECPRAEFLWVAKEAGLKAHSLLQESPGEAPLLQATNGFPGEAHSPLVVTDFIATEWNSHFENQVFSFRLKCKKTLDVTHNKGFLFLEGDELFCTYFR
jgi:hypothetical protein